MKKYEFHTADEIAKAFANTFDFSKMIKGVQDASIRQEENRLLWKYGTIISMERMDVLGATVAIYRIDLFGDTFQSVIVNGECVSIAELAKEAKR